jgi:glycosyltransferase involved in cell wall biosynthesis
MFKEKMTICFFGTAASPHTLKWARYFSDNGHNVHLISYDQPISKDIGNIKVHIIKKTFPITMWLFNNLLNSPMLIIKARRMVKEIKPDVIHGHCVTDYGKLAVFSGIHPLIITAWGTDILINANKNLISKLATRYILKKADLITCDAEHMKATMISLNAESSKIKIINFGIDTKKFSPGEKDKKLKEELDENNSDIIISLRNLEPIYNIETLIKAIPAVVKLFPGAVFVIASFGSEEKKLKDLAHSLNVWNNVRFIGWVSNSDLPRYLRISDIYVSMSLSDAGISGSTAEAMACELPVVITDSGENKEWINGKNGFIIPVKNPEVLAEKIIYLLKNKDKRIMFGKEARKTIEERNDYGNEMKKMENIYYDLCH